jgi:hypothetical protein
MQRWVIRIEPDAPAKPAPGAPCNGCGLCCLAEPCPVGMLVSRRRHGRCAALVWLPATTSSEAATPPDSVRSSPTTRAPDIGPRYACGLLHAPADWLPRWCSAFGPGLRQLAARLLQRWARRVIGAGIGCDAALELDVATAIDTDGIQAAVAPAPGKRGALSATGQPPADRPSTRRS